MPVRVKFKAGDTLLLFVTSSFRFEADLVRSGEHGERVNSCILRAASNKEQPSIAATKSNTVPPASHEKQ
jgi:hypothetical protein